jgi:hypothetical protein
MSERSYTKTRIIQSVGYNGKWVIQGWWADNGVWADIGDPHESMQAAQQRLNEIEQEG